MFRSQLVIELYLPLNGFVVVKLSVVNFINLVDLLHLIVNLEVQPVQVTHFVAHLVLKHEQVLLCCLTSAGDLVDLLVVRSLLLLQLQDIRLQTFLYIFLFSHDTFITLLVFVFLTFLAF